MIFDMPLDKDQKSLILLIKHQPTLRKPKLVKGNTFRPSESHILLREMVSDPLKAKNC